MKHYTVTLFFASGAAAYAIAAINPFGAISAVLGGLRAIHAPHAITCKPEAS